MLPKLIKDLFYSVKLLSVLIVLLTGIMLTSDSFYYNSCSVYLKQAKNRECDLSLGGKYMFLQSDLLYRLN